MENAEVALGPEAENIYLIVQLALPRSAGEIVFESSDPGVPPRIDMNYHSDPVDLKVMVVAMRRAIDIVAHWPGVDSPGAWIAPPELARKHGHVAAGVPIDALLENTALHFSHTTYQISCTCRIGSVVDPRLRVGLATLNATARICANGQSARILIFTSSIVPATNQAPTYPEWCRPLRRNAFYRFTLCTLRDMLHGPQTRRLQPMGNGWWFRPSKWATSSSGTLHCPDGARQTQARPKFASAILRLQPLRSKSQSDGTRLRWLR